MSDLTTAFEITRNSNGNWVDVGVLKEGVHARHCEGRWIDLLAEQTERSDVSRKLRMLIELDAVGLTQPKMALDEESR